MRTIEWGGQDEKTRDIIGRGRRDIGKTEEDLLAEAKTLQAKPNATDAEQRRIREIYETVYGTASIGPGSLATS